MSINSCMIKVVILMFAMIFLISVVSGRQKSLSIC